MTTTEKKKIRHYVAEGPQSLIAKTRQNLELASPILPELKTLYKQVPTVVRTYEGPEGYEEIQRDIQNSFRDGQKYYVIGA